MSGPPRVRSMNVSVESEFHSILVLSGNKSTRTRLASKPSAKLVKKEDKPENEVSRPSSTGDDDSLVSPPADSILFASRGHSKPATSSPLARITRRNESLPRSGLSLSSSYSSDASTDSGCNRTTRAITSKRDSGVRSHRKPSCGGKPVCTGQNDDADGPTFSPSPLIPSRKRCAWITANTDQCSVNFHDEEWGVPVRDDRKLFEYLSLSGLLSELTCSSILSKRCMLREMFSDFDPTLVAKMNERKVIASASVRSSFLSEQKLRAIIENARKILKIVEEFGSFANYCWSFVNGKPLLNIFHNNPRKVPVKSSKAEVISRDMVRRVLRSVSPTVVYAFMQTAGITNDHLVSCYRYSECAAVEEQPTDGRLQK